jgi:hypothetical protein
LGLRNPTVLLKELKALSAICRSKSVGEPNIFFDIGTLGSQLLGFKPGSGWKPPFKGNYFDFLKEKSDEKDSFFFAQLSLMGRGLPLPTEQLVEKAISTHREMLCSSETISEQTLSTVDIMVRRVARRIKKFHGSGIFKMKTHISLASSAAFSTKVSKGGKASEAVEMLNNFGIGYLFEDFILEELPEGQVVDALGRVIVHEDTRIFLESHMENPCGVCQLCQKGYKKREYFSLLPFTFVMYRPLASLLQVDLGDFTDQISEKVKYIKFFSVDDIIGEVLLGVAMSYIAQVGRFEWDDGKDSVVLSCGLSVRIDDTGQRRGWLRVQNTDPLRCRAYAVRESGAKARMITIGPAWLNLIQQTGGRIMQGILKVDPRARLTFRSPNKIWQFLKILKGRKVSGLLSVDLTSATDTFEFDLIKTLWNGFFDELHIPRWHPVRVFEELNYCGRMISWTTALSGSGVPTDFELSLRGSLMGEPQSFQSLSLMSLMVGEYHQMLFCDGTDRNPEENLHVPIAIAGDDYIAQCDGQTMAQAVVAFYRAIKTIPSEGKNVWGRRGGVFCEDYIFIRDGKCECLTLAKPRLLSRASRVGGMDHRLPFLGKGMALQTQLDYGIEDSVRDPTYSRYLEVLRRCFATTWAREIERLNLSSLVPLELPLAVGGISFPGRSIEQLYIDEPDWMRALQSVQNVSPGVLLSLTTRGFQEESHGVMISRDLLNLDRLEQLLSIDPIDFFPEVDVNLPIDEFVPMLLSTVTVDSPFVGTGLVEICRIFLQTGGASPGYLEVLDFIKEDLGILSIPDLIHAAGRNAAFKVLLSDIQKERTSLNLNRLRRTAHKRIAFVRSLETFVGPERPFRSFGDLRIRLEGRLRNILIRPTDELIAAIACSTAALSLNFPYREKE